MKASITIDPLSMHFYSVGIIVETSGIVITSAYNRSSEEPRDNLRLSLALCRTECYEELGMASTSAEGMART